MLQYALLHMFGYDLSMDDLKNFRVSAMAASLANGKQPMSTILLCARMGRFCALLVNYI